MSKIELGTRVKIVDDVGKNNSVLLGQTGIIIGFKWNPVRKENNLPVVQLDGGWIVSGEGLYFEVLE